MKFWYKVIVIISLILFGQILAPFLKEGLFLGHDSQLHSIYLKRFEEALRAGQFPVRFINWFLPGLNAPLFNFYQPGIYYLYLIPRALGFGYIASLNITTVVLWYTSAFLMFLFTKRHFGNLGGILSAYLYLLAPYHILDIFVRSALPEFSALAFVPGIFWAYKAFADKGRGFYLTLGSFFIALVFISHPPTLLMFSPLIFSYIGYLSFFKKSFSICYPLLISFVFGLGIVSFFLLPAFLEQQYVHIIYMRSGYYDFRHHFVCLSQIFVPSWGYGTSQEGCIDGLSLQLGLVHWLVVIGLIFILGVKFVFKSIYLKFYELKDNHIHLLFIFLLILFSALYMLFSVSLPIWETVPYIQFIQYPWRFLSVSIFISSFIAGSLIFGLKKELYKYVLFSVLILSATLAYGSYLKPVDYGNAAEVDFGNKILHPSINLKNYDPEPGYMPKWTQVLPPGDDLPKNEVRLYYQDSLKITLDDAKVTNTRLTPSLKQYQIETKQPVLARFYTHYFPGWMVYVDDKEYLPAYDNIYGYMDVSLPVGAHQVVLELKNTPIRAIANNLSINFILLSFMFVFFLNRKAQKQLN